MANVSISKVQTGAALLKKLLDKADNGDGTLTALEVKKATNASAGRFGATKPPDEWSVDVTTMNALLAAVNKSKSRADRSVQGIKKGIDEAVAEIKKANVDGSASLTPDEQKKVKTTLGDSLLEFARVHGSKSAAAFDIKPEAVKVYVPSRPFVAPNSGTTAEYLEKLVTHYNSWANDNSMHGTRPTSITRYVLGPEETKAIAVHIAKQPSSTAKALLRELSKRINQADDRGFDPKRIYIEPKAEKVIDAVAKKVGLTLDFKGDPKAPKFDYY